MKDCNYCEFLSTIYTKSKKNEINNYIKPFCGKYMEILNGELDADCYYTIQRCSDCIEEDNSKNFEVVKNDKEKIYDFTTDIKDKKDIAELANNNELFEIVEPKTLCSDNEYIEAPRDYNNINRIFATAPTGFDPDDYDFEVYYDANRKKYWYTIETAIFFDTPKDSVTFINNIFNELTKWMKFNGYNTNYKYNLDFFDDVLCNGNSRGTCSRDFDSIDQLYAHIRCLVKGFGTQFDA